MTRTGRRGIGEGSVYRFRNGWAASVDLGYAPRVRAPRPGVEHPLATVRRRRVIYSTKGETRQAFVERLRQLQGDVAAGRTVVDAKTTLATYLETWLASVEHDLRPSTVLRYRGMIRAQIIPALGAVKLTKLQPQQVGKMLGDLVRGGLSPQTSHHVRSVLRSALHDAQRDELVDRNVAALARSPKVEPFRVQPLTPDHAKAILELVADTPLEAPVGVSIWTGLRQSECLGLRWGDIDLEGRRLSVAITLQRRGGQWFVQPTKTDKSRRTVSIPEPLVAVLGAHRQRQREARLAAGPAWDTSFGDLVFTDAVGRPVMSTTLTHRFHDAQVAAGLRVLRWHDLRHGAATLMLASGVDLKVVSELLGHSTIATTANVYAGVVDALKVDAAEKMTRLMTR